MKSFFIFVLIVVLLLYYYYYQIHEEFNNYTTKKQCPYKILPIYKEFFEKYQINQNDINWDLYLTCNYTFTEKELQDLNNNLNNKKIFFISNCDELTRKDNLWKHLVNFHGLKKAQHLMPKTYILNNKQDISQFINDYQESNMYILKKNIQRQTGLLITNNLKYIISNPNHYIIAQKFLTNPFLINGYKINLRIYLLIVCKKNNKNVYIYDDGFMYYTAKPWNAHNFHKDHQITTGYVDRYLYQINPLRIQELKHRVLTPLQYKFMFNNIIKLIKSSTDAVLPHLCNNTKIFNNTSFQLFGVDVAVDKNLNVQLMEINKGPDLTYKDKQDKQLKVSLVENIFQLIGLIPQNTKNRFINLS